MFDVDFNLEIKLNNKPKKSETRINNDNEWIHKESVNKEKKIVNQTKCNKIVLKNTFKQQFKWRNGCKKNKISVMQFLRQIVKNCKIQRNKMQQKYF